MPTSVRDPELFGITESSVTVSFRIEDGSGAVDAPARVLLDGEVRAESGGVAGTHLVRVEGLEPGRAYRLQIETEGAASAPERYLPETFQTLPAAPSGEVGSFATLNDMHFGEERFGGTLDEKGDYGEDAPGFPSARAGDTDVPYSQFMNEDAIGEINGAGVDMTIIKGDIADRGLPEQFGAAAEAFSRFEMPHHAFLGNHDSYALREGLEVDGYALLGQPPAPRAIDLGDWRLLLLATVEPGEHHGVFDDARLQWLDEALSETRELSKPTLLLMHHQPVPPQHAHRYPNSIGLVPEHSVRIFELLGRNPQVRGVLIGHTHRNRVRMYPDSGAVPFIEVNCTKDYPGGWAHYRLYEDGSFRQEVRRTGSARALAHSTRCRDFFNGGYRDFALGTVDNRCLAIGGSGDA